MDQFKIILFVQDLVEEPRVIALYRLLPMNSAYPVLSAIMGEERPCRSDFLRLTEICS